ncbi:hypothetical protein AgCh_034996 [Apium graveolens]
MTTDQVMEKKLYSACLKGDVETLKAMMEEDELTLARASISSCFNQTPLHLASMLGHYEFAKTLPMSVALQAGYDEKMCKVLDKDGRTPFHLAVMNSQYDSVRELMKINSESYEGLGTLLHLCVMYNRLDVLILILESNDTDLSDMKDESTHCSSSQTYPDNKILGTNRSEAEVSVENKNGLTALGMIMEIPEDVKTM